MSRPADCHPQRLNEKGGLCGKCLWASRKDDPEWLRLKSFRERARKAGISVLDIEVMWQAQGGVCALCSVPLVERGHHGFHVDHNHRTGRVRGLLCGPCNIALGHFRDEPLVLEQALRYLESE